MYKIAVIGPESTGKSALTKALALHYSAPHVDEYARSYVEELGRPYTYEDVCTIAKAQIAAEKLYTTAAIASAEIPAVSPIDTHTEGFADKPAYVFFDTDLIITKVWMEYCYKQVPGFVDDQIKTGFFDLYLLCDTDLPWEPDPVREHGDDREYFFEWYRSEVEQLNKPYVVIQGLGDERLNCAILALAHHFQLKN